MSDTSSVKDKSIEDEQYLKHKFSIPNSFTNNIPDSNIKLTDSDSLILFEIPKNFDINKLQSIKLKSKDLIAGKRKRLTDKYIFDIDDNPRQVQSKVLVNIENGKLCYYNINQIAKVFELVDENDRNEKAILHKQVIKQIVKQNKDKA